MNQSAAQAKKTVLVSMLILSGIAVYRGKSSSSTFKRVWATGVVGVFLSLAADFAPDVAGPFAVLVVLGSLTTGGDQAILNLLSGLSKSSPVSSTTGPVSGSQRPQTGTTVKTGQTPGTITSKLG